MDSVGEHDWWQENGERMVSRSQGTPGTLFKTWYQRPIVKRTGSPRKIQRAGVAKACLPCPEEWVGQGRETTHTHTLWGPPALGLVKVKVAVKVWLLMKGKANGNWKWGHREYQQAWYLHSGIFNHSARMDFRTQDIFITKRAKKKKRICFSVLETYQCEFKNLRIYKKQYQKQS